MHAEVIRIIKTLLYGIVMDFPTTILVSFFFFGQFDIDTEFAAVNAMISMLTYYLYDIMSEHTKTKYVVPSLVIGWIILLLGIFAYAIVLDTEYKTIRLQVARDKDVTINETTPSDRTSGPDIFQNTSNRTHFGKPIKPIKPIK